MIINFGVQIMKKIMVGLCVLLSACAGAPFSYNSRNAGLDLENGTVAILDIGGDIHQTKKQILKNILEKNGMKPIFASEANKDKTLNI